MCGRTSMDARWPRAGSRGTRFSSRSATSRAQYFEGHASRQHSTHCSLGVVQRICLGCAWLRDETAPIPHGVSMAVRVSVFIPAPANSRASRVRSRTIATHTPAADAENMAFEAAQGPRRRPSMPQAHYHGQFVCRPPPAGARAGRCRRTNQDTRTHCRCRSSDCAGHPR